jgi:hypothetical protein
MHLNGGLGGSQMVYHGSLPTGDIVFNQYTSSAADSYYRDWFTSFLYLGVRKRIKPKFH